MRIEITRFEAEAVRSVLRHKISELDTEINRTDSIDFKKGLQQTERALERVLRELGTALESSPAA
jgi:hypothetical protein